MNLILVILLDYHAQRAGPGFPRLLYVSFISNMFFELIHSFLITSVENAVWFAIGLFAAQNMFSMSTILN